MSEPPNQSSGLRSVGAIFAGLVFIFVVSLGTDVLFHATGVFPPWFQPMATSLWVFALAYRSLYGVIGCYIAGRLAPNRPMKHAMLLGVIGVVLSIIGVAANWNKGPEFGPRWYAILLIFSALPCAWIGGLLASRKREVAYG